MESHSKTLGILSFVEGDLKPVALATGPPTFRLDGGAGMPSHTAWIPRPRQVRGADSATGVGMRDPWGLTDWTWGRGSHRRPAGYRGTRDGAGRELARGGDKLRPSRPNSSHESRSRSGSRHGFGTTSSRRQGDVRVLGNRKAHGVRRSPPPRSDSGPSFAAALEAPPASFQIRLPLRGRVRRRATPSRVRPAPPAGPTGATPAEAAAGLRYRSPSALR